MTEKELADRLKDMYSDKHKRGKATSVHLFGIKYAPIIKKNEYVIKDIIIMSGIPSGYGAEVSKGMNLGAFVKIKKDIAF